ncbi:unnamed protein product [Coccothraustes coccothraustes]
MPPRHVAGIGAKPWTRPTATHSPAASARPTAGISTGVLLGAQVSVARILVGSRSREAQLPVLMLDPRSSRVAGEREGPQRWSRGCGSRRHVASRKGDPVRPAALRDSPGFALRPLSGR